MRHQIQLGIALTVAAVVLFVFIHPAVIGFPAPPSKTLAIFVPLLVARIALLVAPAVLPWSFVATHVVTLPFNASERTFICSFLC